MKAGYNRASIVYCLAVAATTALAAAFSADTARAALTWDASGSGTAFDGSGTWSSTGTNWWNGSSDETWDMISVAQFGVGSGGNNQYSVSLGSPFSVGGLSFQNQNYTLAGSNTLTIAGSGIVATVPATINVPMALSLSQTWTVAAGKLLDVNGAVSGGYGLTTTGGTTVLAGNNSYSGGTVVAGGKLFLDGANTTPTISVSGAATLGGTGSASSALATVATGGTLNLSQNTGSTFALAGLTFAGSATLLVNDANGQYSATPAVSVGPLTTGHGTSVVGVYVSNVPVGNGTMQILAYSGAIGGGGFGLSTFRLNSPRNQGRQSYALINTAGVIELSYSADYLHWTGAASTAWDTSTTNWKLNSTGAATTYIDSPGDIVVFDDGAGTSSTVSLAAAVHPSSTTFSNTASSYFLEGAGGIYGGGPLTVKGAGAVTLATSNGYTGGTNVTSGTLNDGAAGSLGGGPLSVTGGVANLVNPQSIPAVTLGGGLLNLQNASALGSGTLAISGGTLDNTSGAAMTLSANNPLAFNGSFTFRGSNPLNTGTGAVTISGGPALNVSASTLTLAGPIAGGGGLTKSGNGTLVLMGSNTYSGTTTVVGGNLVANAASLSGPVNVVNNSNLTFNQTVNGTFGQTISGNGGLNLQGGGTLIVSATQNYRGPTVILAGTLQLQTQQAASIQFTTGGNYALAATSLAGVVPLPNWNVVTTPAMNTLTTLSSVNDSAGNSVASLSVNFNSSAQDPPDLTSIATPIQQLMNSGLTAHIGDSGGNFLSNQMSISSIPYPTYSLYLYVSNWNGDPQDTDYLQMNQNANGYAAGTIVPFQTFADGSQTGYTTYQPATVLGTALSGGTTQLTDLLFSGMTASSLQFQWYPGNSIHIDGFQIINTGGVLPASSPLSLASGAAFDLYGINQTIASLADVVPGAGGSTVTDSLGGSLATLTLSPTGGSTTFSGTIRDGNGMLSLTLAGSGRQVLTGSNAYSGNTTIAGGVLQAVDGLSLPTASNLVFSGSLAQTGVGAILQSSGTFSRLLGTGSGAVQWTGDGGFAAVGGPLTVSMSPGVPLIWNGTVSFVAAGSVLTFGSPTANNQVIFTDSIDLGGGTRQIDVAQGAGGDSVLFSGNLSDSFGGAGLLKTGAGILILSGTNSYLGGTMVEGGTLIAAVTSALPGYLSSGSVSVSVNSGATLAVQAGALPGEFASADVDKVRATATFASGANFGIQVVAPESFTYNSNLGNSAAGPLGFVKLGSGELILSGHNTYTGGTTVLAGTLVAGSATALADGTSLTVGQGGSSLFAAPAVAGPALAAPSSAGVVAVPEPTALALVLVALGCAAAYRRFRK